ncbi:ATP-binding protein [Pseudomonas aeruginosa]
MSAQAQAELAQERQQSSMRQLERRLAGSLIPQRFLGKTFENYRVEHEGQRGALLDLQAYADDFADVLAQGRCLLLVGRTGTGKTHLSCAVANSIVRRGYTALFRTVQEVIRHVRSSWGPGGARRKRRSPNWWRPTC